MEQNPKSSTRIETAMTAIRQRITSRSLSAGDKLPSIRAFASLMAMSTSTIVEAYERLAAEGVIKSRPGAGFFVASQTAPLSLSEMGPRLDRLIDPLWVSRQSLEAGTAHLKPGCGWLPPEWMPQTAMRRALRKLAHADPVSLSEYGEPLGLPALRQMIASRMADKGIETSLDQIILTGSGTQAIDLLCRFLLEPGDTVLVDDPCYFNFQALLRAHRARIVSVPYTPSGPDTEAFEKVLTKEKPRLYITNSGIHNPTGATLSPARAHRILKLADQHGLTIIEDDIFADFEQVPSPRLAAFDGLDRVIHIGSFSKTLSAAARCGYIAVRRDWVDPLVDLKIATSFGGAPLNAELVLNMLRDPSYRKHMAALKLRLSQAMSEVSARLRNIGIEPWLEPQAGLFLWAQLPGNIDAADIARDALARNIVLAPGNAFSHAQSATRFLRFNVSQCGEARLFDVLQHAVQQHSTPET